MYDASKMVGVSAPLGFFDPLGFAKKADEATMMKYRESGTVIKLDYIPYIFMTAVS